MSSALAGCHGRASELCDLHARIGMELLHKDTKAAGEIQLSERGMLANELDSNSMRDAMIMIVLRDSIITSIRLVVRFC